VWLIGRQLNNVDESLVRRRIPVKRLASALSRPPSLTSCLIVYYLLLAAFGLLAIGDPKDGTLGVLLFTHIFVLLAPFQGQGGLGVLVLVGIPLGIALCAVRLTGWCRVIGVMGLLIAANSYGVYTALQLGG